MCFFFGSPRSHQKCSRVTCGPTCYRGAEPPNPKKCSRGAWGGCRPEVGCSGGCLGGSRAPSRAPHLGPALPQAPPRALLGVRGFGTSVAGRATRNSRGNGPQECRCRSRLQSASHIVCRCPPWNLQTHLKDNINFGEPSKHRKNKHV